MATAHQLHIAARKQARHYAVQAVYQWHMAGASAVDIEAQFRTDYELSNNKKVDGDFFHDLLHGVITQSEPLEELISDCIDRPLAELDKVELSLLKAGAYELQEKIDVPFKSVINEYVNLAKKFGATDGHKFINGVLDKLSVSLRPNETAGRA